MHMRIGGLLGPFVPGPFLCSSLLARAACSACVLPVLVLGRSRWGDDVVLLPIWNSCLSAYMHPSCFP